MGKNEQGAHPFMSLVKFCVVVIVEWKKETANYKRVVNIVSMGSRPVESFNSFLFRSLINPKSTPHSSC